MPTFKVIKAHDGMQAGSTKTLPHSSLTAYMVKNGWWQELTAPAPEPEAAPEPSEETSKTTKKSQKKTK